jgi:hypothetical protein
MSDGRRLSVRAVSGLRRAARGREAASTFSMSPRRRRLRRSGCSLARWVHRPPLRQVCALNVACYDRLEDAPRVVPTHSASPSPLLHTRPTLGRRARYEFGAVSSTARRGVRRADCPSRLPGRHPRADAFRACAWRFVDHGRCDDVPAGAEELLDGDEDGRSEAVGAVLGPGDDLGRHRTSVRWDGVSVKRAPLLPLPG